VAEDASARHGWDLRVIDDAADDPTLDQPDAFLTTLRQVLGAVKTRLGVTHSRRCRIRTER
jgi:hypothetical protein